LIGRRTTSVVLGPSPRFVCKPSLKNAVIVIAVLAALQGCSRTETPVPTVLSAPAGTLYVQIDPNGTTVLPNGRLIRPLGLSVTVAPHPFGLTLSSSGNLAITANSGTEPLSISIIEDLRSPNPIVRSVPPGPTTDEGVLASVFMGLAISPDDRTVYVAGGQKNGVYLFDIRTGEKLGFIDCEVYSDEVDYRFGYIGDMVLSRDGSRLYAVDQMHFRLVIIDTAARRIIHNVSVGRYPFGIALSPDETKVYIANVGMFEYSKIPGTNEKQPESALEYPAFAYGTREMRKGVMIGDIDVPGLGDPNAPESFSVWTVSLNEDGPRVTAKVKTGTLVGDLVEDIPAVGGSSPNSLVATSRHVFVSNGNNDSISVLDLESNEILTEIAIRPFEAARHFRGVIPFGLAVSPDENRLFVAESGINAVGVIDIPTMTVVGHIPVGWFPAKLAVSPDGEKLIVANAKGFGSGPNGGREFEAGPEGTYIGNLMKGTVTVLDIPCDADLEELTRQVEANNFRIDRADSDRFAWRSKNPIPLYGGERPSPIRHIAFISKENRTYDEVFGQIEEGEGDPTLARYGRNATFANNAGTVEVVDAVVMPNHLELAQTFAIADNFYVDADVSADGHRWLVNTYPNEWVETTTAASYGDNRTYDPESTAPGSLAMTGSAGATYPEDYNEAGSMWDHLERHGVDFFNFGFGIMFEPGIYHESFKYTGIRHFVNYPVPAPIFNRTSKTFPTYNMAIPDQFRVDQFIREFEDTWGDGGLPSLLTVILPNDHGAGDRPEAGFPFRESYMADNDLAVGRIVEFLSHTRYWNQMAIFITEDDAQNGVDHIDAHRSILMVISPWAKRNYVGTTHYSFGSIFKTFWNVLGLPYLNQYDAGATDLADLFTDRPDFTPYTALAVDLRVFDPQKALDPFDEDFDWEALRKSPVIDDLTDMMGSSKEREEDRREHRGNPSP
jgi:YVTN family beta-propeller protein